jgi:hypothetical protein
MNHPKNEEWVPYLFGETTPEERLELKQHLQTCTECRDQVATWERNLGRLDAWKLRPARRASPVLLPVLRWAAAAAVILALGFAMGRVSALSVDTRKLQAALEPRLRQQLRDDLARMLRDEQDKSAERTLAAARQQAQQVVAEYDQSLSAARSTEVRAIYASLDKLAADHLSDFISLKKDVDTVAVMTDAGLRRTESQLVQFADYSQPVRPSAIPPK